MKGLQKTGAALLVMLLVSGCASTNQKSGWFGDWGKCALAGVAIGGAAGALGDSDRGVLGAAVGAAVGAAICAGKDKDKDGVIKGTELNGLKFWVDDGDAITEDGELQSLDSYGITEIVIPGGGEMTSTSTIGKMPG